MKRIVSILLMMMSVANIFAADWVLVSRGNDTDLYINVENISYNNIWYKEVYKTAQERQNKKSRFHLSRIPSYHIIMVEATNDYSKYRIKSVIIYDSQGNVLDSFNEEYEDFQYPVPDSMGELYCTIAKKLNDMGGEEFRKEMFFENATSKELIEFAVENQSNAIRITPYPEHIGIDYPPVSTERLMLDSIQFENGEVIKNPELYKPSIYRHDTRIISNNLIYDLIVTTDCPYPIDIAKRLSNFYKADEDTELIRDLIKDAKMGFKITVKHGENGTTQSAVVISLPQVAKPHYTKKR